MQPRARRNVAAHDVHVSDLFERGVGHDHRGTRWERGDVLHRIHIEINLVGNSEPHMRWRPSRLALDVEVVIDVYVVRGAVSAARAAAERKRGYHVVVNSAQRADRTG